MIFDTDRMRGLRVKYASEPDYRAPMVVRLDRCEELAGEKDYLEELLTLAPEAARQDWIESLLDERDEVHLNGWFEAMLFGWLSSWTRTTITPHYDPATRSFTVMAGDRATVIEASTHLIGRIQREHERQAAQVIDMLGRVRRPYILIIKEVDLQGNLQAQGFVQAVEDWLDASPEIPLVFADESGNRVVLEIDGLCGSEGTAAGGYWLEDFNAAGWIDPCVLKSKLESKARLRKDPDQSQCPYVIALLLEPPLLTARAVLAAWLGSQQYGETSRANASSDTRLDRAGAPFYHSKLVDSTMSGMLVLRPEWNPQLRRRELQSWYIENPHAPAPVDAPAFPAKERFVVTERTPANLQMRWRR